MSLDEHLTQQQMLNRELRTALYGYIAEHHLLHLCNPSKSGKSHRRAVQDLEDRRFRLNIRACLDSVASSQRVTNIGRNEVVIYGYGNFNNDGDYHDGMRLRSPSFRVIVGSYLAVTPFSDMMGETMRTHHSRWEYLFKLGLYDVFVEEAAVSINIGLELLKEHYPHQKTF